MNTAPPHAHKCCKQRTYATTSDGSHYRPAAAGIQRRDTQLGAEQSAEPRLAPLDPAFVERQKKQEEHGTLQGLGVAVEPVRPACHRATGERDGTNHTRQRRDAGGAV